MAAALVSDTITCTTVVVKHREKKAKGSAHAWGMFGQVGGTLLRIKNEHEVLLAMRHNEHGHVKVDSLTFPLPDVIGFKLVDHVMAHGRRGFTVIAYQDEDPSKAHGAFWPGCLAACGKCPVHRGFDALHVSAQDRETHICVRYGTREVVYEDDIDWHVGKGFVFVSAHVNGAHY